MPTARAEASAELPTALPLVIVPTPPRAVRLAAAPRAAPPAASGESAQRPAAQTVPAGASPAPRPAHLASGRSYSGSVTLAGGEKIELGGIVWSETEPRALLNDRVLGVGGFVEGYEVTRIETDRVELKKDGATITVTVK